MCSTPDCSLSHFTALPVTNTHSTNFLNSTFSCLLSDKLVLELCLNDARFVQLLYTHGDVTRTFTEITPASVTYTAGIWFLFLSTPVALLCNFSQSRMATETLNYRKSDPKTWSSRRNSNLGILDLGIEDRVVTFTNTPRTSFTVLI